MNYCCSKLDDYLDGELADHEVDSFQESLVTCEACRKAVENWHQTTAAMQSGWQDIDAPQFEIPVAPQTNLVEVAHRTQPSKLDVWDRYQGTVALAIVCLIIAITGVIGRLAFLDGNHQAEIANRAEQQTIDHQSSPAAGDKTPTTQNTIAKAVVEFPRSLVGIRLDEPEDDFTFINVYETVDSIRESQKDKTNSPTDQNNQLQEEEKNESIFDAA